MDYISKKRLQKILSFVMVLLACFCTACCNKQPTLEDASKAYKSGDFQKAAKIFEPLAEKGDPDAQVNIAFMYYCGLYFPKDHRKAAEWYLKAAKQNHANAQFSLGTLYENGEGVPRDLKKAYFWYSLAEKNGDKDAQRLRQEIELKLPAKEVYILKKRINSWKPGN